MLNSGQIEMSDLLELAVNEGASDLHLEVGVPPVLRIHGHMQPLDCTPLMPEDTERLMKSITSEDHQQRVREGGGSDFIRGVGKLEGRLLLLLDLDLLLGETEKAVLDGIR